MTRDTDLIRRSLVKHNRDLLLDQANKAMPDSGDEELDHGHRMYRAGVRDLARRLMLAPAAVQEPVAWLWRSKDGRIRCALPNAPSSVDLACAKYDGDEIVPLYAHPSPAPVVPAEGLAAAMDRLQTEICCADGDRADAAQDHSDGSERVDLWPHTAEFDVDDVRMVLTALRSAPPVGARVKPLVWREDRDTWVSDCEVGTYRVGFDDGWWCSLEGAESWDWDSPDDPRSYHGPSTAQNAAQADFVARIRAALLPAGEGE